MDSKTKKLIREAKKILSEKKLFLSEGFSKKMQALVMSVTKAFKKPPVIRIYEGGPESVAYTDSKAVNVNLAHPLIQTHYGRKATMWEKVNAIKALVMHEAAHIAKTDFSLGIEISEKMINSKTLWPLCNYADKVPNAAELIGYCDKYGMEILKCYHEFDNILEDSYINNWLCGRASRFSGIFAWYLKKEGDYTASFEDIIGLIKSDADKYGAAINVLLCYAKYGKIKCEKVNESHELLNHLRDIEDEIDRILDDDDPFYRICHFQKLFCYYWPMLKLHLDSLEEDQSDFSLIAAPSANVPSGTGGATVKTPKRSSTDEEIEEMMSDTGSSSASSEEDPTGPPEENPGKDPEETSENGESGVSEAISNGSEDPEDNGEGNKKDTSIEKLLNDMAEDEANSQLNAESEQRLGQISKGVNNKYSKHLTCRSRRIAETPDNRSEYSALARQTDPITKAMAKYFLQKFRDDRDGERKTGLFSGTGIDWDAEARDEIATFYKETDPDESKPIAVAYLGDESGSMCGQKADMNRLTAITVYNFCDMLDLPVGVYGHTSGSGADCDFRIYADFRKDPSDRYRMMNIEGDSGNKDGYALRLASERLLAQNALYKVLIITSDGLPSDYRSREEGIHDIQDCIKTYSRKGIHYIAAAMDSDKDQIRQIYGPSFLDISELKTMPKRLVSMLAKQL